MPARPSSPQSRQSQSRQSQSHQSQSHRSRPSAFAPVKLRGRKDGWSPHVQCAFLAALYASGSVTAAAKAVGRSRASAYKLRERPEASSFAASWDKVLSGPSSAWSGPVRKRRVEDWRKLTDEELFWRYEQGLLRPVIHRGKMVSIARKPDNSALLRLLARLDGRHQRRQDLTPKMGAPNISKRPASVSHSQPSAGP